MIGWLILAFYLTGFLFTWRRITGMVLWSHGYRPNYLDAEYYIISTVAGLIAALFLVISLPISILASGSGHWLIYMPPDVKRQQLEHRIRELEREAGYR